MADILVDARLGWGSGIGRVISNTLPRVAALLPQHHFDALVYIDDVARAEASMAACPNVRVLPSTMRAFSLREQWKLSSIAKPYDLTWFTNYWVPLIWRRPCYVFVHDLLHLEQDIFPTPLPKRLLSKLTFRKVQRSALAVSYLSRFTQREFERRFGAVALSGVHSCGIDHADWPLFDPDAPPAKRKLLLAVGASKMHKNFDTLLTAWTRARVSNQWTLVIISPDDKLRSSVDLGAIVAGAGRTEVRKGISNDELRALYGEAAIMLTPSRYEGFGLPFMEAMQAGAYCITSTAEAMVETGEGAFARFVNPLDIEGWTKAIEESCAAIDEGGFDFSATQARNMRHASGFVWQRVAETAAEFLDGALSNVAVPQAKT